MRSVKVMLMGLAVILAGLAASAGPVKNYAQIYMQTPAE